MIKAVLFDKDGTLIDFTATYAPATAWIIFDLAAGDETLIQRLAEAVNFDMATVAFKPASIIIAGTGRDIAAAWASHLRRSDIDRFGQELDEFYLKHTTNTITGFPFTASTLAALADMQLPMGIATNDSEEAAYEHAEICEIAHYFRYFAGYDSGHGEKPGGGMVRAFADHCGLAVDEIAMVGDSLTDMRAGRDAGAICIAVTSGMADAKTLQAECDHLLKDISDLPELIAKVNQPGA